MRFWRRFAISWMLAFLSINSVFAHEFWIMPERFQLAEGENVAVHLREGEDFDGKPISYHSRRFHQFEQLTPSGIEPVISKNDAVPAANITFKESGRHVLLYQSKLGLITYDDMAKFESFLMGMKLDWAMDEHAARGLSNEGIREAYFRYAKALVQVGQSTAGGDRLVGMPLELVAMNSPYDDAEALRVQLFFKKETYADQPIFVFTNTSEGIEKRWFQTDDQGIATIPLDQNGSFQINSVHLQPASDRMNKVFGAVWQTLWASMTFEVDR